MERMLSIENHALNQKHISSPRKMSENQNLALGLTYIDLHFSGWNIEWGDHFAFEQVEGRVIYSMALCFMIQPRKCHRLGRCKFLNLGYFEVFLSILMYYFWC